MEDPGSSREGEGVATASTEPNIPDGCVLDEAAYLALKGKALGNEGQKLETYHTVHGGSLNLPWFTELNLSLEVQNLLCFSESCLIATEGSETVGKMFIKVEQSTWDKKPCILVHSSSYAKLRENCELGTTITGFLTSKLHVIQEFTHEWCRFKADSFDRKTLLSGNEKKNGYLHCHTTFTKDKQVKSDDTSVISNNEVCSFVSEAANIVLLRLIMQQKKVGEVPLKALTKNGKLTRVDYRVLGNGFESVKGENTQVWGIKRSVWEGTKVVSWDCLFNFYGRMVLRCQPESDHAMIPLWFRPIEDYNEMGENIGLIPPFLWACDPDLYSKYKVKKIELASVYKTYLMDNPALRALLSDFMQKLLLVKPKNVIEFTQAFFHPFLFTKPESQGDTKTSSSNSEEEDEYEVDEDEEWLGEGDEVDVLYTTSQLGGYGSQSRMILEPRIESIASYNDSIVGSPIESEGSLQEFKRESITESI